MESQELKEYKIMNDVGRVLEKIETQIFTQQILEEAEEKLEKTYRALM